MFMKLKILFCFALCLWLGTLAMAQQAVGRGPISAPRDPEIEKQSEHNLEVARYYFYKRKPPKKGIEDRLREIIDINPTFGKMDGVYFLLGEVYARAGDLDQAKEFFGKVIKEFPDSQMIGDAKKRLAEVENQGKGKKEG
jgi:outer membrane protein assembly factor BamD (BamD/ComL family)